MRRLSSKNLDITTISLFLPLPPSLSLSLSPFVLLFVSPQTLKNCEIYPIRKHLAVHYLDDISAGHVFLLSIVLI